MPSSPHLGLRATLRWRLFQLSAACVRLLPEVCERASSPVGDLAWLLAPGARRAVRHNLRFLQPHAGPRTIRSQSRSVFRSVVRYYVELMRLPATDISAHHRCIAVEGYDYFAAARARGKGVIIASMHLGPAELVLQAFNARGVTYTAMVERLRPEPLSNLFLRIRQAHGHTYVYPDIAGTKQLLRTLRAGGVVALLMDRDVLGRGVDASFCGGTIRAPAGPIVLARLTGAAVVPAVASWLPSGGLGVTIMPAMPVSAARRDAAALRRDVERVLAQFEPHLRRRPGQWLVLERMWQQAAPENGAAYTELHNPQTNGAGGAVGDG